MTVTVYAEGVDYSATADGHWTTLASVLRNEGKRFAGRYAVYDKSPSGRGITNAEYLALTAAGIDVFLYYEENEAWMLGGYGAGVRAATNALDVIRTERMPQGMPVYYSHDIDPTPDQFAALDDCLQGAASIVGLERVGFYGGWAGIDHVHAAGTARWFVQTIAWQYGNGVHPAAHLHQYNTGQPSSIYIGGVDVDLVAAVQLHYGGAKDFAGHPTTTTTPAPTPVAIKRPPGMSPGVARGLFNPHAVLDPRTGKPAKYSDNGPISQSWLKNGNDLIPPGKTWKESPGYEALDSAIKRFDGTIIWKFGAFTHTSPAPRK